MFLDILKKKFFFGFSDFFFIFDFEDFNFFPKKRKYRDLLIPRTTANVNTICVKNKCRCFFLYVVQTPRNIIQCVSQPSFRCFWRFWENFFFRIFWIFFRFLTSKIWFFFEKKPKNMMIFGASVFPRFGAKKFQISHFLKKLKFSKPKMKKNPKIWKNQFPS